MSMSVNEICYRLQAMATMCVFKDAVGHDLSRKEINAYNEAKDIAVEIVRGNNGRIKDENWISICESFPPKGQDILVCDIDGDIYLTHRVDYYSSWHCLDDMGNKIKNIRAWMFLPKPYKEWKDDERTDQAAD